MRYLVCHGSRPLLHLFHHKTGSLPEVRNTELHIRIPENAQVVALSYTRGARTNFYLSPAQDPLLTLYERIQINQRVSKWSGWPPQRSILLRPRYESLMMTEWIFCRGRSSASLCEKEPMLSHPSVATTATSTISPLNIRTAGLKDRLTDRTSVTLFSQVFRVYSQWVSLKDTDNKSHTFYPILYVYLCDFSFP